MISIQYGSQLLPNPDAVTLTAVWGARAIDEGRNGFSLVHDRQDSAHIYNSTGLDKICKTINANLSRMSKRFTHACDSGFMSGRDRNRVCLLQCDGVTVIATCGASYGYVYLLAFLADEWPGATDLMHVAADPPPPKKTRKPKPTVKKADWYRNAW